MDKFFYHSPGLDSPIENAIAVTPSDSEDLEQVSRCIFIGAAGDLRVAMKGGGAPITIPVQAGLIPLRVSRIYAAGTTATGIVAGW
jgi:hypothetical protein